MGQSDQSRYGLHPRIGATFALMLLYFAAEWLTGGRRTLLLLYGSSIPFELRVIERVIPSAFVLCGCLMIWMPAVRWTRARRRWTLYLTALYAGSVIVLAVAAWRLKIELALQATETALFALSMVSLVGGAAYIIVLNILWYDPPSGARAGVPCPECGYDLRAACSTRCPECGCEHAVSDLICVRRHNGVE